jgi:hypothetical protein
MPPKTTQELERYIAELEAQVERLSVSSNVSRAARATSVAGIKDPVELSDNPWTQFQHFMAEIAKMAHADGSGLSKSQYSLLYKGEEGAMPGLVPWKEFIEPTPDLRQENGKALLEQWLGQPYFLKNGFPAKSEQ